jgi:hypothetical protein
MVLASEGPAYVVRYSETNNGRASFAGIQAERVQINVIDLDYQVIANSELNFGDEQALETVVRVGDKPARVRVVDRDGASIAGAWVRARSDSGAHVHGMDDSDSEGWALLFGLPRKPILLDVQHPARGKRFGIPVDAAAREFVVVLDAEGSLELRIQDGTLALAGVETWLETTDGVVLSSSLATDSEGTVRHEPLGQGTYRLGCKRADCWPTTIDLTLANKAKETRTVEMRRLGDLRIQVFDAENRPRSGVTVQLRSVEFGQEVVYWIREERVQSRGLTSDASGEILVRGLPHGKYTWSVAQEERDLSGTFELEAGHENSFPVRLN